MNAPISINCHHCKTLTTTRDEGKTYGMHFPSAIAVTPCAYALKTIPQEAFAMAQHDQKKFRDWNNMLAIWCCYDLARETYDQSLKSAYFDEQLGITRHGNQEDARSSMRYARDVLRPLLYVAGAHVELTESEHGQEMKRARKEVLSWTHEMKLNMLSVTHKDMRKIWHLEPDGGGVVMVLAKHATGTGAIQATGATVIVSEAVADNLKIDADTVVKVKL